MAIRKGYTKPRHLTWDLFESRIRQGPPSLEPIPGRPVAEMFIAPGGSQIGLRILGPVDSLPPSPLAEISVRSVGSGKTSFVEVATSNSGLYPEFYSFCCAVADRVQVNGEDIALALAETLQRWASLLRKKPLMSEETQIGLLGELWFLERIAGKRGWRFAGDSWRGPEAEEHDFTLATIDVEVKTTRSESRLHTIGSLKQLLPKKGRCLFVHSIQLTHAAGTKTAMSLPRAIARVLTASTKAGGTTALLVRNHIERYGWSDEDAELYAQEWELRTSPALVAVNSMFPAIVPPTLRSLGRERLARIGRVTYQVKLDGLGVLDGTKAYSTLLER